MASSPTATVITLHLRSGQALGSTVLETDSAGSITTDQRYLTPAIFIRSHH